MYKLLVTDVDGTLLDDQSRLPELNKKAVRDCLKNGINVILATGKSINAVDSLIRMFGLKFPQITLNGGVILNSGNEIIKSTVMDVDTYLQLIGAIEGYGATPIAALVDGRVVYRKYHPNMKHVLNSGVKLTRVDDLKNDYFTNNTVSVHVAIKEDHPCDRHLRDMFSDRLFIVRSGEYFFDFLNKNVNKGNALKEIMKMFKLKKEEVAVIGDSYNDLSMFEIAGLRIAVKNSYPDVLKKADIVTEENYNCGFAKAIYKHILKN